MIGSSSTPRQASNGAGLTLAWRTVIVAGFALPRVPTGGRRSKPSPRFFAVGDARSRCASRSGAGVNTGVP